MNNDRDDFPRLRTDLRWTLHQFADGPSYTVVDPTTGLAYQVGLAEYALASLLDGKTSLVEAAAATRTLAQRSGKPELAVDEGECVVIANWLAKMQLTISGDHEASAKGLGRVGRPQFSPLCIKMPLGRPDRIVEKLSVHAAVLTTRLALTCALVLIAAATIQVLVDLDRWTVALGPLVAPDTWWILGAVALALRVLHELAHAVVAHRLDVRVNEVGILWILLIPLPYVDVSQSWQRSRRRQRILIAAAGMLAEMVVASIAVFVFSYSSSELTRHLAATVALTASAITLLFNANVLMRFDGYHMLVDAFGLPNLYTDATRYWHEVFVRVVLGKQVARRAVPTGRLGLFFRCYGLAALTWRIIVFVGLVLAAEHLLGGLGVLLAIAAVLALVVRLVRGLPVLLAGARPVRVSLGVVAAASLLTALWHLPISPGHTELGVVRYREPSQVRAASDGFVRELFISRGQRVRKGDPLLRLENVELENEVATLQIELAASELRYRGFLAEHQMAGVAAEAASVRHLRKRLAQRAGQLDGLTIRAVCDGAIAPPTGHPLWELSLWMGRFVPEGTEVMRIVHTAEMEVVILVDQPSHDVWSRHVGRKVKVRRPIDWNDREATLTRVAPRASDHLPSESFGAHQGGTLAVRAVSSQSQAVRLLRPRFETRLTPCADLDLHEGQRVLVTLEAGGTTVGDALGQTTADWIRTRLARHSLLRQLSSF